MPIPSFTPLMLPGDSGRCIPKPSVFLHLKRFAYRTAPLWSSIVSIADISGDDPRILVDRPTASG